MESCEVSLTQQERRKFDHFFYEALNAKAQGKYDVAMDLFRYCHALDSTNANVLVELGTFTMSCRRKTKHSHTCRRLSLTIRRTTITI